MKRFLQLVLITFILQDLIANNIQIFSYEDELFMILGFVYCLFLLIRNKYNYKLSKYEIMAFIGLIIYMLIGIIGNLKSDLISLKFAMLSLAMTIKGYLLYFEFRIIFQNINVDINFIKIISKFLKVILIILVGILVINLKLNFLKVEGIRFGIETYSIGFSHPTELAFFTIISMCIILFYNNNVGKNKGELTTITFSTILVIFSGRSKAVGFMLIFILMFYFVKIVKRFNLKYFIITIPLLIYIALPRIISELLDGARGSLYTTAVKIAKDYFPLGSGFGTFGSYVSRIKYSFLYFKYGISNVWGLSPDMPLYIADTYWAMILGETGIIGMILMLLVLLLIFIQFIKLNINYKNKVIIFGLIVYTLIASIAEPIYSSNKCAALFITLAFFATIIRKNNNLEKEEKNGRYIS